MLLEVKDIQLVRNGPHNRFNLHKGEILGFAGLVGSGRTELALGMMGALPTVSKDVWLRGEKVSLDDPAQALACGIGLLPESRKSEGLITAFSIRENISLNNLPKYQNASGLIDKAKECASVDALMRQLSIKAPSGESLVVNLSGGNQQKVVIARWINHHCDVLVFDEPTRGIDVGAKAQIYALMRSLTEQGYAIIMISSELPEVIGMCDRVAVSTRAPSSRYWKRPPSILKRSCAMQQGAQVNTSINTAGTGRLRLNLARLLRSPAFYPFVGLVVVTLVMILASDTFLTASNLSNIARQVSINAIIAVGMTCVILTGGIDLSVGPVMALSGTLTAGLMVAGLPPGLAIGAGLLVGVAFGIGNGLFVAYLHMPPIIVTLATMGIARGFGLMYTDGYPISGLPEWFAFFGRASVFGLQVPILIMLITYLAAYVLLQHTRIGRYIYAIGGNEEAVRLSGVRAARFKLLVYGISGFTAAIAGLVLTSRLMSGQPNAGVSFELDAIAAVVLGGASIAGGRGVIIGTLLGAMLLGVLNNGLNMLGVSPYVQSVIKGGIILLAIFISRQRHR
ncbi:Ribose transport system permease protein RbsC [Pseudomonas fluorescens]|uniref:Ribose transport system permease protein RbsC n=6 Tax=Gammaproteobacteria TaxID=1236 RepID=A0A120G8Z8_PSEFL|nr:Ribose transport system permease protein RbsC [Pseudomonas fluorescens]